MLRAKDLMVGDRVLLFGDKPVKVDCIGNVEVYLSDENGIDWRVTYEHIKPIPLTTEILEKNGFKKAESDFLSQTWAWAEKSEKIYGRWVQITFYNKPINGVSYLTKIETCSQKGDGVDHIHSCDIESIHELQHALRLCGINLEIKL